MRIQYSLIAALILMGCASVDKDANTLIVRAEQSIAITYATLNTFVQLDHANRELWRDNFPTAHLFAEYLREKVDGTQRGLSWIEAAAAAKDAYKKNRSPDNKATLTTALATLDTVLSKTQRLLDNVNQPTP